MIILYITIFFVFFLFILIYISNNILKVTHYEVKSKKLPDKFDNLKIVHISDVHSKLFGKENEKFIQKIERINPDIILMTGDIIDDSQKDVVEYVKYFSKLYQKYPTYYSIGNHERKLGLKNYNKYINELRKNGVNVIINGGIDLTRGNEKIRINALKFRENMQPNALTDKKENTYLNYMAKKLGKIDKNVFNILLAHDAENFEMYEKLGVDLVFSGHIHGGLIRFGKICLLSPRRKFFPKYAYGKNKINNTTIITSSGIGHATIPIRLFNRPEIGVIVLKVQH